MNRIESRSGLYTLEREHSSWEAGNMLWHTLLGEFWRILHRKFTQRRKKDTTYGRVLSL